MKEIIKVKYVGCGIMIDVNGKSFIGDIDGYGSVMDNETGELYRIIKNNGDNDIEIERL